MTRAVTSDTCESLKVNLYLSLMRRHLILLFFHCLYRLSDLFSGHGDPVPISGVIGQQGRIHPGWSANPSQGTHTLSFTHAITHYGQFRDSNQPRSVSLDCGRKPEYPEETHQARGEHANSTHTAEAGIEPPTLELCQRPREAAEQGSSPRTGIGSDQEDSRAATMDGPEFQESFVTSGVFNVTELVQVSRTPVVTGTGPNFSLGELQGHLAYDLNPTGVTMRRTLPSTSSSGSKRQKSSSVEGDIDTSPGGEYYTSPNSPASSSRNWPDEMEGGISPVKKTEMDSPSPQESSPRLGSFTQHHRPVIAVHSGISRSPHPSSSLHFSTAPILPQPTSTYFPHTAIRYPPHLTSQDPLKDLVTMACDPSNQQPSPVLADRCSPFLPQLNGSGQVKVPPHYISSQMLAPPPPPALPRLTLPPDSKPSSTSPDAAATSPTSPTYSAPGTPPANRSFVGIGPRDPASLYQAQSWYLGN
ncbi:hypothetical protein QTP70_030636 [Hemibagrus guttatus]|uniref:Nuclear factor 1 C-type n=1 Tax=Hemibagrus guttatus TaxID=175788 RepID=A0AAE0V4L7_9TELE|nr:hypothetical protein QTP70_030636 [Hemibagrus guttatus]